MKLESLVDIVSEVTPVFREAIDKVTPEIYPFYSELYNLTYGESEAYHKEYLPIVGKPDVKNCIELFAGAGVESYLLSQKFPEKNFYCADINGYSNQSFPDHVNYIGADCITDKGTLPSDHYDVVFVGGAVASFCMFDWWEIERTFLLANRITKLGGTFFSATFFGIVSEEPGFEIDYSVDVIKYDKNYKGYKRHWANVIFTDPTMSRHKYFDIIMLESPSGSMDRVLCNPEGTRVNSHSFGAIKHIAFRSGFELNETLFQELGRDTRCAPFTKISDVVL